MKEEVWMGVAHSQEESEEPLKRKVRYRYSFWLPQLFHFLVEIALKVKKWSSQWTQIMQLRKEAWKKFRTSTGFEPVTSRYRCDALPTELWSHRRWEQVNRPFYSCGLSTLAFEWMRGWWWPCFDTNLLCFVMEIVLEKKLVSIRITCFT